MWILRGHKHPVYDNDNKCNGGDDDNDDDNDVDNVCSTQLIHPGWVNGFEGLMCLECPDNMITEKGKHIYKISMGCVGDENWRLLKMLISELGLLVDWFYKVTLVYSWSNQLLRIEAKI